MNLGIYELNMGFVTYLVGIKEDITQNFLWNFIVAKHYDHVSLLPETVISFIKSR